MNSNVHSPIPYRFLRPCLTIQYSIKINVFIRQRDLWGQHRFQTKTHFIDKKGNGRLWGKDFDICQITFLKILLSKLFIVKTGKGVIRSLTNDWLIQNLNLVFICNFAAFFQLKRINTQCKLKYYLGIQTK